MKYVMKWRYVGVILSPAEYCALYEAMVSAIGVYPDCLSPGGEVRMHESGHVALHYTIAQATAALPRIAELPRHPLVVTIEGNLKEALQKARKLSRSSAAGNN